MKFLSLVLLLVSSVCSADSLSLSFGPSLDGTVGEVKALTLGYEFQWGSVSLVPETGMWNEPNGANPFTFYGGVNIGVHVVSTSGIGMRVGIGPCVLSQTDDHTSGTFEFHIQARVGLEVENFQVGFEGNHWSDGQFIGPGPNLGRDTLGIYLGIPL